MSDGGGAGSHGGTVRHGGAVRLGGTVMTAMQTAVRQRPRRAARAVPLTAARLLRLELRRNAMPWILPLIAALSWFDSYRPSTGQAPLWVLRTFWNMGQGHTIIDFGPFVAGVAAWMGSRDARRGTADLVTATARRLLFTHAFVGAGNGAGTPAQQAVQAALLQGAGVPFAAQPTALGIYGLPSWALATGHGAAAGQGPVTGPGPATERVYTAARRLAALPAATRHAWLATHLAALRSGQLTLAQLP